MNNLYTSIIESLFANEDKKNLQRNQLGGYYNNCVTMRNKKNTNHTTHKKK